MRKIFLLFSLFLGSFLHAGFADSSLELASVFTDHMVLQRGMPVPVWGWAEPGRSVTVEVGGVSATAKAEASGRWQCELPALKVQKEPVELVVTDGETTLRLQDVLVGEVWICFGQSNMDMGTGYVPEIQQMADKARKEQLPIRNYMVPHGIAFEEQSRCEGVWRKGPPGSAVAAVFAIRLYQASGVPVGIVQAAWGSSWLEGWMPASLGEQLPEFKKRMEQNEKDRAILEQIIALAQENPDHQIKKYSNDPEEEKKLKAQYGLGHNWNANVYARTRANMLYNAMLHPLIPMACRGMVYYQGEANSETYEDMVAYRKSQALWLKELRKRWHQPNLFFISIMLPGYGQTLASGPHQGDLNAPDTHSWAILRDSQLGILALPHTAVVNTIDLGEAKNIHPHDKIPVGERAARVALRETLGEKDLEAYGPMLEKAERRNDQLVLSFQHAEGLKTTDGKPPKGFWITEDLKEWIPAKAELRGTKVVISLPKGYKFKQLRYAYAAKPDVNLINKAGLPAYPFKIPVSQP